jgi:hypothetical protein
MKLQDLGLATSVAIVLTILTAAWLWPLNGSAVAVVFAVYLGLANGAAAWRARRRAKA